ncbi:iron-containing alcohol dehydrogenase family protein [Umezakia ovalisporum]|uniref:iron-containing alcohol dehydrogenase family protein n=1 Tax=Umezakia ovalisporum TaxID=75695 RepID=UPI0035B93F61
MPNQFSIKTVFTETSGSLLTLTVAPTKIIRGAGVLQTAAAEINLLGIRPLIIAGNSTLAISQKCLQPVLAKQNWQMALASYGVNCCEASLQGLKKTAEEHQADVIIGFGGGKALDTAKLVAHELRLPVVTIPTSGATCAATTALSNVYSESGAFLYDVALSRCPDLLILDYDLIQTAPQRTLVAGIGDAIAKWYEASVSSGNSQQTLIISAVQQARVLRDILLQKSATALKKPGSKVWQEVIDATVLLAGVIGGLGGAQCRTVAAHAVHNGLTHISGHGSIHGEKVAYGILVQLRLEEMLQSNQLAASARQQLLKFYAEIGLPQNLKHLGLGNITLGDLQTAAEIALNPQSDIYRLPFKVVMEQLMAAMVSTTAPTDGRDVTNRVSTRGMSEEV